MHRSKSAMLSSSSPLLRRLLLHSLHRRLPFSAAADLPTPTSPLTQESVIYVLKTLYSKPDKALSFFTSATTQHGFKPGPAAYNLMLRALANKPSIKDFWSVLHSMDADGHSIDNGTYLTLLTTFKKLSMTPESSALAQFHARSALKAASDAAISSAATIVLESSGWTGEINEKLQDVNLPLSELTVAKVLREVREQPQKALGFFRWAARCSDYKHGSVSYNAMARVLGREDSVTEFWGLIEEMKGEGHDMDIDTYVKLSRQFQKCRMMMDAVQLYEYMMDGPYKPAIQDCGVLLRRIAMSGDPDLELVFRVVKKYEDAGYSLSKMVYDGIHRSLTSTGRFDEAEEISRKMKQEGFVPDNITYSQMVYGLCKAKKLDEACQVLDEMEVCGCIPDLKTWTVLIQGHCSAGEVNKAVGCFTKMIEKGCQADADVLEVLLRGLCSEKRADSAYTLFVEMVSKARLRPWQATYKYLIQEMLSAGKLEEALKLLNMMKSQKFPPYADPFSPHISKYGTVEDAREFLKALTVSNFPSHTAYLHVFKSFFQEARYAEAQDLLYKCPHHIRKHPDICKLFGSIKVENAA